MTIRLQYNEKQNELPIFHIGFDSKYISLFFVNSLFTFQLQLNHPWHPSSRPNHLHGITTSKKKKKINNMFKSTLQSEVEISDLNVTKKKCFIRTPHLFPSHFILFILLYLRADFHHSSRIIKYIMRYVLFCLFHILINWNSIIEFEFLI